MFTGQKGCFCCSDPPDPPPPCEVCEACTGDAPGDCADKICPSFVIEVEGFANTTTQQNCSGYTATGTECTAYNGTFILEKVSECLYRSDSFLATVPIHTILNGQQCYECENVEVFYQLRFETSMDYRIVRLTIHRLIDGDIYFAAAHVAFPFVIGPGDPVFGPFSTNPQTDGISDWPTSMCHEEPLQQFEDTELYPARFVTYRARSRVLPFRTENGLNQNPERTAYGDAWAATVGQFLGYMQSEIRSPFNKDVEPFCIDECGSVQTDFLQPISGVTGPVQQIVLSPHWVCCKDDSFDCDLVRDELAKGLRDLQAMPLLRITDIRCGT